MAAWTYTDDGALEYDDTTRTITDHTTDPPTIRPYTQAENDAADQRAAEALRTANDQTISTRLVTVDLPAMQAILGQSNADLRADPAQEIKDTARAVRRLTRKVEHLLEGTE